MHSWLDQFADLLGRARSARPAEFLLWEIRLRIVADRRGVRRVDVDGGCRIEWSPEAQRRSARFAVGCGPTGIRQLQGGAESGGGDEWRAAVAAAGNAALTESTRIADSMGVLEDRLAAAGATAAPSVVETSYRARAWCSEAGEVRRAIEGGSRVRSRMLAAHETVGTEWVVRLGSDPPWSGADQGFAERAAEHAMRRAELNAAPDVAGGPWLGPVAFLEPAAAWLAHELAHAAIEWGAPLPPGPRGLVLVDDPASAAWPAGFETDDAGNAAVEARLWGPEGSGATLPSCRRDSIRSFARPFLSATRIVPLGSAAALADGIPVIVDVGAGRFDPVDRTILLRPTLVICREQGQWRRWRGLVTALINPVEAWPTAFSGGSWLGSDPHLAFCSRQGSGLPVCVGAPTLVLDHVRVDTLNLPTHHASGFQSTVEAGHGEGSAPSSLSGSIAAPPRGGPFSPLVAKGSTVSEALATATLDLENSGHERGPGPTWPTGVAWCSVPTPPLDFEAPDGASRALARRLRSALADAVGSAAVAVHVSCAVVREELANDLRLERRVAFARTLLGTDGPEPRWIRTAVVDPETASWDASFLEAVRRDARSWELPVAPRAVSFDGAFALDAFAAADLVRACAGEWLRLPPGLLVAAACLSVDDPGFAFPARGADLDSEGRAVRPLRVVEAGRLRDLPRGVAEERAGLGPSTGSAIALSWRAKPARGWRRLVVRAPDAGPLPEAGLVVTRLLQFGGGWCASGYRAASGRPVERFAQVPVESPEAWLLRVTGAAGPPLHDGGGVPIEVGALAIGPA